MRITAPLSFALAATVPVTTAFAQEGTISQSFTQIVKTQNVAQFEEAYKNHLKWHRQNNDTWTWNMWSTVTGELGRYIVITDDHTWADFDSPPFDVQADNADAIAKLGRFVESVASGFARAMTEVSMPAANPVPLAQVIEFSLKSGKDGDFLHVIGKFAEAAKQVNWPGRFVWLANESGGTADYILVIQHENWASFAPLEMSFPAVLEEVYGRQEANALLDMISKAVESETERTWIHRPDLSYVPGN